MVNFSIYKGKHFDPLPHFTYLFIIIFFLESQQPFLKCRHVVVFIGFWIFLLISGYRLNMSVSIVAMVNNSAHLSRITDIQSESCPILLSNSSFSFSESKEVSPFAFLQMHVPTFLDGIINF